MSLVSVAQGEPMSAATIWSLLLSALALLVSISLSIVGMSIARRTARKYGAVAGADRAAELTRQSESEHAARVLDALQHEVERAMAVARHNAEVAKPDEALYFARPLLQFQLGPFEVVLRGEIAVSDTLLRTVRDLALQAQHVNAMIADYRLLLPPLLQELGTRLALSPPTASVLSCKDYLSTIQGYCQEASLRPEGQRDKRRIPEVLAMLKQRLTEEMSQRTEK